MGHAERTDAPQLSSSIWYALGHRREARLRTTAYDYMRIFGEGVGKFAAEAVACFTAEALRRWSTPPRPGHDEFFWCLSRPIPDELARTRDVAGHF